MSRTIKLKCDICDKEFIKSKGEYDRRIRLGKTRFMCSRSCGVTESNRTSLRPGNKDNLIPNNRRNEYSPFKYFTRRIRARIKAKNNIDSDIDESYLKKLWEEQKGICPLTNKQINLPLGSEKFKDKRSPYNASLDRINSSLSYVKGNVRFVSLIANLTKAEWDDKTVIEFCRNVINHENHCKQGTIMREDRVKELREELEKANWKLPQQRYAELTKEHLKLLGLKTIKPCSVACGDKLILNSFTRICTGAHGPYVEFEEKDLAIELELTKGQEWRNSEKYSYVKYLWLNPVGIPSLKIYKQKNTVKYADYKPGFYYVDFYAIQLNGGNDEV